MNANEDNSLALSSGVLARGSIVSLNQAVRENVDREVICIALLLPL